MKEQSTVLPSDQFDRMLSRLIGLPNGAHTAPAVDQAIDFYGNTTHYMIQTVRTEDGPTAFVTQVNAQGSMRYILPPSVLKVIDRQRDAITKQLRRRHGKRLVEDGKLRAGGFTPEMRAKAAETRRSKAAKNARRSGR